MKKVCLAMLCVAVVIGLAMSIPVRPAEAFPQFSKEFTKKYVGDEITPEQQKLAAEIKKVKACNVCHDPNKTDENGKSSKKFRNAYGMELAKILSKDDKKDKKKINAALEAVASKKAPDGDKTFGDRLKEGMIPCDAAK